MGIPFIFNILTTLGCLGHTMFYVIIDVIWAVDVEETGERLGLGLSRVRVRVRIRIRTDTGGVVVEQSRERLTRVVPSK